MRCGRRLTCRGARGRGVVDVEALTTTGAEASRPTRDAPLRGSWTVARGLDAYLDENGFTREAYDAPWTPASFLGIRFSVPNTPRHRWAIMLHDLHHVATGYGTNPAGEGEIAAWELRRGLRRVGFYVGAIVVTAFVLGILVSPRRVVRAWREAGPGTSLFHGETRYRELLALTIGELRKRLRIPERGLAAGRRGLHSLAPGRD